MRHPDVVERDREGMHATVARRRVRGALHHAALRLLVAPVVPLERRLRHHEQREAAVTGGGVRVSAREQREHRGAAGERAPRLLPVDAPTAHALVLGGRGARLQRGDVRSDIGLGDGDRDQLLASRDARQPMRALLLRPAGEERLRQDLRSRRERARRGERGGGELLGDDDHREVAHAGAAVLLRDRGAEEALLREGLEQRVRDQQVLAVDLLRNRRHLVAGELARHVSRERGRLVLEIDVVGAERGDDLAAQLADPLLSESRA